ncbi:MAG: alpha/beta hydrolase [Pirellula sp.]|nr:alpha/beta hydrolase [Pirellula sp.]
MYKILLLTGMTPDYRIFERLLPLLPTAIVVDWIPPVELEPIVSYAARLSRTLKRDEPMIVCGVSFGGIVAREMAYHLNAACCVLISSVRSPRELPPWFRLCRVIAPRPAVAILKATGTVANHWPERLRSGTTWRLRKLAGKSGEWHRWATAAVLNWKPSQHVCRIPSRHIHGDRDATFPIRYTSADTVIRGGGHVLPLTHCEQIAEKLRKIAS